MFFNRSNYYDRALDDSAHVTAERAVIVNINDEEQPGVAIRNGKIPRVVLTVDAAHRLAIEIVEALEETRLHNRPIKRQTAVSQAFEQLGDL